MVSLLTEFGPEVLFYSFLTAIFAGIIKGLVGLGMPTVLISGLSTILSPEWALAGLIVPTLVTNGVQALRQGRRAAYASVVRFRYFLIYGGFALVISAQFTRILPHNLFLLLIGLSVSVFAIVQLAGLKFTIRKHSKKSAARFGLTAGLVGGISGVWGPPTVAYLTALGTEKKEQLRVQGVIYGLGAMVLFFAHLGSGILNAKTILFSIFLVVPSLLGMWCGSRMNDRIDQSIFRTLTLLILTVAGLNLILRALLG
ncbi:sulfite exporter TauE/SafE family protein [Pseudopelagicola sp. nBUS_20]|uniref:sulfite exporter TauE/SafE family protein n=1 Tax=Pseudopelagicola sp. nBUS_20 TaxID=3395317 RepID=UPI003EB7DB01